MTHLLFEHLLVSKILIVREFDPTASKPPSLVKDIERIA